MFLLISAALSSAANQARVPMTGETGGAVGSANGTVWPPGRFWVGSASTNCVSDKLTGLMWVKDLNTVRITNGLPNGGLTSWQIALDSVKQANATAGYCGYTDWRLPNVNELKSLINYGKPIIANWLNIEGFVNVKAGNYWSSTSFAPNTNRAWDVHFESGNVSAHLKADRYYVWPVRGGR